MNYDKVNTIHKNNEKVKKLCLLKRGLNLIIVNLLILSVFLTVPVKATETKKEYNIENIGIKIQLDSSLIDIVSGLKNNEESVNNIENKDKYLQNYANSGIVIDAVDSVKEKATKEIIVAAKTSSSYANMEDFNKLNEEDKKAYREQIVKSIEQQAKQVESTSNNAKNNEQDNMQNITSNNTNISTKMEVKENALVHTENGNSYVHILVNIQSKENQMDMSIYYTIMNGRIITISFRYYAKNYENMKEMERQTIENITFYEVERPQISVMSDESKLALGSTCMLFIIIAIIVIGIRIKDRKYLDKNIKDIKIKQYSKFGGGILFFWSLCFFQILLRVIDISNVSKLENMDFYKNAITLQSTIWALVSMYQIYIIVKRKNETPKKIIRSNILMMVTGLVITLVRMIYAIVNPLKMYDQTYFKEEADVLIFSLIYPTLCIVYFTFSERVRLYYYLPKKKFKEIVQETKIYRWIKERKDKLWEKRESKK